MNFWKQYWFPLHCVRQNVKRFFRCIKYSIQRITRGYCDQDIWNLNNSISVYLTSTIRHLAKHHWGYPGRSGERGETDEDWTKCLNGIADMFEWSSEDSDFFENPYEEAHDAIIENCHNNQNFDNRRISFVYTPEEKKIIDKYKVCLQTQYKMRQYCLKEAFKELNEIYYYLWD